MQPNAQLLLLLLRQLPHKRIRRSLTLFLSLCCLLSVVLAARRSLLCLVPALSLAVKLVLALLSCLQSAAAH